jgi:hypothetical protein
MATADVAPHFGAELKVRFTINALENGYLILCVDIGRI